MERYTNKELRKLVENGHAIDVSYANNVKAIPEYYSQVGYAAGVYGCSGMLFKGQSTGKLYAITGRTQAIYLF